MKKLAEIILNTDDFLLAIVSVNVSEAYIVLFLIILLETGLIFFPFLPGDGLLFSAGVVAATTDLDIRFLIVLLIAAAILGNLINYNVGKFMGHKLRHSNNYFIKNHFIKHIPRTEEFYVKYGGSAIIIGRFFPVIRTYIPFLAGIAAMDTKAFLKNTAIGATAWILLFSLTGFFVGEITWVKNNYGLIFLLLIIITLIPFFYAVVKNIFKMFFK